MKEDEEEDEDGSGMIMRILLARFPIHKKVVTDGPTNGPTDGSTDGPTDGPTDELTNRDMRKSYGVACTLLLKTPCLHHAAYRLPILFETDIIAINCVGLVVINGFAAGRRLRELTCDFDKWLNGCLS